MTMPPCVRPPVAARLAARLRERTLVLWCAAAAACSQGVDASGSSFGPGPGSASNGSTATAGTTMGTSADATSGPGTGTQGGETGASSTGGDTASTGAASATSATTATGSTGTATAGTTGAGSTTGAASTGGATAGTTGGASTGGVSGTGTTGGASTGGVSGTGTTGGAACDIAVLLDFSSCPSGFTTGKANALAVLPTWACGNPTSGPGGTGMWATNLSGDYMDDESSYLDSPSVSLADCQGKTVQVRVRHWYDIEPGYDGGNIQVSIDGGNSWQVVTPTGHGYDEISLDASYVPPAGQPGFSGFDAQWRESFVDLTPYVGEPDVRLRFVFGSDFLINYAGWYIDEVEVLVQ